MVTLADKKERERERRLCHFAGSPAKQTSPRWIKNVCIFWFDMISAWIACTSFKLAKLVEALASSWEKFFSAGWPGTDHVVPSTYFGHSNIFWTAQIYLGKRLDGRDGVRHHVARAHPALKNFSYRRVTNWTHPWSVNFLATKAYHRPPGTSWVPTPARNRTFFRQWARPYRWNNPRGGTSKWTFFFWLNNYNELLGKKFFLGKNYNEFY